MSGSGSQERIRQTLDEIERRESAYGDDWFYLGLRSFYLHESDRFEESRVYAERSLQGNPRNGNASHNMAHVFYETSDYEGGLDFLNDWIVGYSARAPFFSHLNWHMALFELTQGRYARAQEIYEQCIRPSVLEKHGGLGPPLADATSLLWRLELYGKGVSERDWSEVRAFAADQAANPGVSFQDAHAALALAATHDRVAMDGLIDGINAMAAGGNAFMDEVVLPLVKGIEAFGREAYDDTIRFIEPIDDRIVALGGSQAQRAVFHDTLLQAYLRTQRYEHAEVMLRKRLEHRHTARDFYWLARSQAGTGKIDDAQVAARHAQHLWAGAEPRSPELAELSQLTAE
jgi:tetratricopeptide (TPR) repeat protein